MSEQEGGGSITIDWLVLNGMPAGACWRAIPSLENEMEMKGFTTKQRVLLAYLAVHGDDNGDHNIADGNRISVKTQKRMERLFHDFLKSTGIAANHIEYWNSLVKKYGGVDEAVEAIL